MRNPGLTISVLIFTACSISLGLLIWGPKGERETSYPFASDHNATPTPSPLPVESRTEVTGPLSISYHFYNNDLVELRLTGDINGTWLKLRRHKSSSGGEKGWEAAFTSIESDYKPHVEKKGTKWLIVFASEDLATEFQP